MSTVNRARAPSRFNPANWIADAIVAVLVMSWWKRLCYAGVLVGVTSLAAHLFGGFAGEGMSWDRLPAPLSERAEIFARCWAAADKPGMTRFIRPADEAKLWRWMAANPPPAKFAGGIPPNFTSKVVSVDKDELDGAAVKVRFAHAAAIAKGSQSHGSSDAVDLQLAWLFTGGHWLFLPDLAAPAATRQASNKAAPSVRLRAISENDSVNGDSTRDSITSRDSDRPSQAASSRNVVIPSTVPPWQRSR